MTTMRTSCRSTSSVRQVVGVEAVEAGPQREVGVERDLGLQADEVLDRVERPAVGPLEQQLAGQRGPVEGAAATGRRRTRRHLGRPPWSDRERGQKLIVTGASM